MRLLLLALMIALLPMRGWAGDVMTMEMASGQPIAMQNIASTAYSTGARGIFSINSGNSPADCPEHAGAAMAMNADTPTPHDPAAQDNCGSCSICQICHTVALTSDVVPDVNVIPLPLLQPEDGLQFASAVAALRLKPPIS
ncbi:MAG: hypothetical protein ABI606_17325 [Rhodoferax sp.]